MSNLDKLFREVDSLIDGAAKAGSGNWGHKGRPGQQGGSLPKSGGGVSSSGGNDTSTNRNWKKMKPAEQDKAHSEDLISALGDLGSKYDKTDKGGGIYVPRGNGINLGTGTQMKDVLLKSGFKPIAKQTEDGARVYEHPKTGRQLAIGIDSIGNFNITKPLRSRALPKGDKTRDESPLYKDWFEGKKR